SWSPQMLKILSQKFKLIVFDHRGMGKSTSTDEEFSIELFTKDLFNLLNALNITKAHLLGYSMGVYVGLNFVLKHPDMVDNLILYGGSCGGKELVPASIEVMQSLEDILNLSMKDPQKFFSLFFPDDWLRTHKNVHQYVPIPEVIPSQENIHKQFKALISYKGVYDRLKEINNKTLIVTGKDDIVIPAENSVILAKKINQSLLLTMKGGHGLMWQRPDDLAVNILNFLES
ncbi:MAG: alpha/beta fold hydrolase, partial [Vampirovibrionia bacterium]